MYLNLNEAYLEKNKEKARELSISEVGEIDGKKQLTFNFDNETLENLEIEDDHIQADFDSPIGWISVRVPLDVGALEQLLEVVIRRMNKIKTLLQSVK